MNVKEAALATGLPGKTLRYYEDVGLVAPDRAANGYRVYDDKTLGKLVFIARGRSLGFGLDDCRKLLDLYENSKRSSADVKAIAEAHLELLDVKQRELKAMQTELRRLVTTCHGDDRPDCPIVDSLAVSVRNSPRKNR